MASAISEVMLSLLDLKHCLWNGSFCLEAKPAHSGEEIKGLELSKVKSKVPRVGRAD